MPQEQIEEKHTAQTGRTIWECSECGGRFAAREKPIQCPFQDH